MPKTPEISPRSLLKIKLAERIIDPACPNLATAGREAGYGQLPNPNQVYRDANSASVRALVRDAYDKAGLSLARRAKRVAEIAEEADQDMASVRALELAHKACGDLPDKVRVEVSGTVQHLAIHQILPPADLAAAQQFILQREAEAMRGLPATIEGEKV